VTFAPDDGFASQVHRRTCGCRGCIPLAGEIALGAGILGRRGPDGCKDCCKTCEYGTTRLRVTGITLNVSEGEQHQNGGRGGKATADASIGGS